MAFTKFKYKGRWVTGMKDITRGQWWFSYTPIMVWSITALFIIIKNAICDCLYLTVATQWPVIMITLFAFLWTYFVRKQVDRRNYEYE